MSDLIARVRAIVPLLRDSELPSVAKDLEDKLFELDQVRSETDELVRANINLILAVAPFRRPQ